MRKHLILLLLAMSSMLTAGELKMMVFSDPHVLHQSLISESKSFAKTAYLVEYSQPLFEEALRVVRDSMPDVLLIPGDLTYNGDKVSHQFVATELSKLTALGIRVVIIPGNHDINEPGAKDCSSTDVPTGPITIDEFRELYAACGYRAAEEIYADSLSYLIYLDDRTALVCMNSSMDNTAKHQSAGGITEDVLAWAETAAAKAIASGRYPIGVTHHQMVVHFENQALMDADHIANKNDDVLSTPSLADVQRRLTNAGITSVFTGHMHIESLKAAKTTRMHEDDKKRTLYDISTNALCGYSGAIRTIRLLDGEYAALSSQMLGDIVVKGKTITFAERQSIAHDRNTNMTSTVINSVASQAATMIGISAIESVIKSSMESRMSASYTNLFCALTQGNEYDNPQEAEALVKGCFDSFSAFSADVVSTAELFKRMGISIDITNLKAQLNEAQSTILTPTIYSIAYNTLDGITALGVDEEDRNTMPDSDYTIPTQYTVPKVATSLSSLRDADGKALRAGIYSIDGSYLGPKERLTALPQGVYIVDGTKIIR